MSRLTALTTQLELELASLEAQEIRKSVKHHEDMSKIRRDSSASTEGNLEKYASGYIDLSNLLFYANTELSDCGI